MAKGGLPKFISVLNAPALVADNTANLQKPAFAAAVGIS
jgi:hypothetical protein